jgi:predicted ATP-dependent endonuclease of OLD family
MSGISDEKEIRNEIDKIISDTSYRETFQQNISQKLTSFLNSVWKQHKIRVCVQFEKSKSEEPILKVQIEDNDKRGLFYATPQRSAGFKHIFSLLLSWAFQNRSGSVKNNIILIDEPEQHLHPSAIRDIRDELLKIGKDNSVIVATHSNYMIDTEHPERHLLVKKEKGETSIKQLDKNSDFYDDEVLYPAFGLNFFKELLPENIIIVEGNNDKIIIGHAFCKLNDNLSFSIKATNGAGSCSKFAKFLSNEKIKPFIIFDEDAKDKKNDILKQQKDFYSDNNVFTLKDLVPELPDNATIEDLLPFEFVQTFFKEKMNITLEKDNQAIMQQLKKLLPTKEGKQKITDLKVPLANRFCDQFKTNEDLEKDAPKLSSLVKCLIRKLKIKAL